MKLAVFAVLTAAAVPLLLPVTSSASPYIRFGVQDDTYLSAGPWPSCAGCGQRTLASTRTRTTRTR
jgi:hypothetical protein